MSPEALVGYTCWGAKAVGETIPGTKHHWKMALGGASKAPQDVQKGKPGSGAAPPSIYLLIPLSTIPSMCSALVDTARDLLSHPASHPDVY